MNIFDDFRYISAKEWKQKIQFELNGLDYNQTLICKTIEGINIRPFYTKEDRYTLNRTVIKNKENSENCIIGSFSKKGNWINSKQEDILALKTKYTNDNRFISIDTTHYQNAGANIIQELAYAIATADLYLTQTGNKTKINFYLTTGNNFFFESAKHEALKIIWDKLCKKHSIARNHIYLNHTISSRNKNLTTTDHIRDTLAFISNNIPYEVKKNCYYIESLTKSITEESWGIYELISTNGGIIKQLELGNIQRKIKQSASKDIFKPRVIKNIRKTSIEPIPQTEHVKCSLNNLEINDIEKALSIKQLETKEFNENPDTCAGFAPFLRGYSSTMFIKQRWQNTTIESLSNTHTIVNIPKTTPSALAESLLKGKQINSKEIVFNISLNTNLFDNIAFLRAARVIGAKLYKHSLTNSINIHCNTISNKNTTSIIKSLSAIFGGSQSINITQDIENIIVNETFITKTIDPFGGSSYIENLTLKIITKTWEILTKKM